MLETSVVSEKERRGRGVQVGITTQTSTRNALIFTPVAAPTQVTAAGLLD